jgi:diacylglycerol kinase family enzyme
MTPETVICLLNPLSNDGAAKRYWPQIAETLTRRGIAHELIEHQGDLAARTEQFLEEHGRPGLVLAGLGGDGTHMAIVNGLMRYRRRHPDREMPDYVILPLGTGNNLAKSFGIGVSRNPLRSELRRAACATAFGARYRLDLGTLGDMFFADAFTVGVDAHILRGRNRDRESLQRFPLLFRLFRGYPVYFLNGLKSLLRCHPLQAEIEVDGQPWYRGPLFNLIVNNSRIYAGEFDLTQTAFANDGLLDLLIFTGHADYLCRYLLSVRALPRRMRKLAYRPTRALQHIQGRRFSIRLEKPIAAQVDGEELPPDHRFEIGIAPQAVTLRLPVEPA